MVILMNGDLQVPSLKPFQVLVSDWYTACYQPVIDPADSHSSLVKKDGDRVNTRLLLEDVVVDHIGAGCIQPGPFCFLFGECMDRGFHVDSRSVVEHLLDLNLLGVHEQGIRDLHRAEFLALTTVDTRIRHVGKPDQVEHETRGQNPWFHVMWLLGGTLNTITDWTGFNTGVALDTLG